MHTLKLLSLSTIVASSLILLLLVLRIVNSLVSCFPTLILFQTNAACVARIEIESPATVTPDTELCGEFRPDSPDL